MVPGESVQPLQTLVNPAGSGAITRILWRTTKAHRAKSPGKTMEDKSCVEAGKPRLWSPEETRIPSKVGVLQSAARKFLEKTTNDLPTIWSSGGRSSVHCKNKAMNHLTP